MSELLGSPVLGSSTKCCRSIDFYRSMIQSFMDKSDYDSALFWADKMVCLSNGALQDVYNLAKSMYLCGQYHRAATLLNHYQCDRSNLHFRCLAARCLYKAREYQKALEVLDLENKNIQPGQRVRVSSWEPMDAHRSVIGQVHLIRGKIYEALMNRILASQSYKEALRTDIYCYEAFELLTQHQMLSRAEEVSLLQSLQFSKTCSNGDAEFVKYLYASKVKKYPTVEPVEMPMFPALRKNLDMMTVDAERLFYNCDFQMAHKIASQVITEDPYHVGCLPVFIACLIEMGKVTELFRIAHKLVEVTSDSALAWYSVGAYYFLIGKQDTARRHLNKSLSLNPVFGPAWLLFGHSFAIENEHDQAMAAYFKATQLMKGCHLPMLHVGMECGLSNNPQLAMKFLEESRLLAPKDPFIRHEMGVVKFSEKKYEEARQFFMETVALLERPNHSISFKKWEPLYNNLGHVLRKLQKYEEAFLYHQKALVLCPSNASTHTSIGLIHAISGRTEQAIESFHKALSIRRDDACSNTMLRYCIEKLVEESNGEDNEDILLASDGEDSTQEAEGEEGRKLRRRPRPHSSKTTDSTPKAFESMDTGPEIKAKGSSRTPAVHDAPGHLKWFKNTLSKFDTDSSLNAGDQPRHTSTPAAALGVISSPDIGKSSISDSPDTSIELRIRRRRPKRDLRGTSTVSTTESDKAVAATNSSSDEDTS